MVNETTQSGKKRALDDELTEGFSDLSIDPKRQRVDAMDVDDNDSGNQKALEAMRELYPAGTEFTPNDKGGFDVKLPDSVQADFMAGLEADTKPYEAGLEPRDEVRGR